MCTHDKKMESVTYNNYICINTRVSEEIEINDFLNNQHETINLQFQINNRVITRSYCRRNIQWFAEKVKDNTIETEKLCHDPSECNLTHYNPKYFNYSKLCGYSIARIPCPYGTKCNMLHSLNFPPIIKPNYNESIEKVIVDNKKTYNSAGVMIFSTNDMEELCVNLFKSAYKVTRGKNIDNYYCGIAGGGINEDDKSIASTACRELYEESCKTLLITEDTLKNLRKLNSFVEIVGKTLSGKRKAGLFACYICKLSNLASLDFHYDENRDIIKNGNYNYAFNETTNLVKIPINDIKKKISSLNYSELKPMGFEVNGVKEYVDERTLKCLWKVINEKSYGDDFDNFEKLNDFEYYSDEDGINTFHF